MKVLRRLLVLARHAHKSATVNGMPYTASLRRVIRLYRDKGMGPGEAFDCGLLDPGVGEEALSACLGKYRLRALQRRLNPRHLECLLKDKAVFYPYCQALGLRVPKLYAVFDDGGGWTGSGHILSTPHDWELFVGNGLPDEFVVKPAWGVYGTGFHVFTRSGRTLVDTAGVVRPPGEVVEMMRGNAVYGRWILQERLKNHLDLQRLSGTPFLQTARLITCVGDKGEARSFASHLKIITGGNTVDNLRGGATLNFPATIGRKEGCLGPGLLYTSNGDRPPVQEVHPETGARLVGFRLPFWEEALRLVERAALLFLPIRTIGWDVAITAEGPSIIEGNMWWEPNNTLAAGPSLSGDESRHGRADLFEMIQAVASQAGRHTRGGYRPAA